MNRHDNSIGTESDTQCALAGQMDEIGVVLAAMRHHATQLGQIFDASAVVCLGKVGVPAEIMQTMMRGSSGNLTTERRDLIAKHPEALQVANAHIYSIIARKTDCLKSDTRLVAYSYVKCADMPVGVAVVMAKSGVQQNWFLPK